MESAFSGRKLGTAGLDLKNVFIKAATYEGMYENGMPARALKDFHVAMAKGGVALTTVSYGAVSPGARTFREQMYIREESLAELSLLADEVHRAGGKISIQLTHCGYFTKNRDRWDRDANAGIRMNHRPIETEKAGSWQADPENTENTRSRQTDPENAGPMPGDTALAKLGASEQNEAVRKAPLAPSRLFNAYGALSGIPFSREMSRTDMERVAKDFARAALGVRNAGFDAAEVHMGHGYLLSQFLSPATNRRKDEFGGSIANRARFPLEVFSRIRETTGGDFPLLVKLNLDDGLKRGFTLDDCKYVALELEKAGCDALVLSGGFTSKTPFYLMRGEVPLRGMIRNGKGLAEKFTMALIGPVIIRKYPFRENFFLDKAMEIRKAVKLPLVYLGGVDSREGIERILDAGFDFIAIGRALIHDPDFLLKIKKGQIERSECTRCNDCVVEMDRNGIRCTLNPAR